MAEKDAVYFKLTKKEHGRLEDSFMFWLDEYADDLTQERLDLIDSIYKKWIDFYNKEEYIHYAFKLDYKEALVVLAMLNLEHIDFPKDEDCDKLLRKMLKQVVGQADKEAKNITPKGNYTDDFIRLMEL